MNFTTALELLVARGMDRDKARAALMRKARAKAPTLPAYVPEVVSNEDC